jgi:hypothetical protein
VNKPILSRLLSSPITVWATAAAVVALSVAAEVAALAPPDMAFLLYAAGRVQAGDMLYRDLLEINPPLIVALTAAVLRLARSVGASEFLVYRLATAIVAGGSLLWIRQLLRRYAVLEQTPRRVVLLAAAVALFPLAGVDFGEREHLVLALLLPYIVLLAIRLEGREPTRPDALTAGALAGAALALKPHFAVAWLALECYARVRGPRTRRFAPTAEIAAAVAVLSSYAVGIMRLTPAYVDLALRLGPAYARYLRDPFYGLLVTAPGVALAWFAILAAIAGRRASERTRLWGLLGAGVVGCVLAGALQEKGLRYHFYPAFALGLILLAVVAAEARERAALVSERLYAHVTRPALTAIVLVLIGRSAVTLLGGGPVARRERTEFLELVTRVRHEAQGGAIGVLSYNIASAFPLVNYAGVPLASRFPHLWLFPVSYWDELHRAAPLRYHPPEAMGSQERFFFEAVKHDLLTAQPRLLLVLRPARDDAQNGLRRLHYIEYLSQDRELAAFLAAYERTEPHGEYDIYRRLDPGTQRVAPPPSIEQGQADARLARVTEVQLGLVDGELLAGCAAFVGFVAWSAVQRRRRSHSAPMALPTSS